MRVLKLYCSVFISMILFFGIGCSESGTGDTVPTNVQPVNPVRGQSGFLNAQPDTFALYPELAHTLSPYFSWMYSSGADTHMVVSWGQTNMHKAVFHIGTSSGVYTIGSFTNSMLRKHVSFVCDGLSADTRYYCRISDVAGNDLYPEFSFKTAPAVGNAFRFLINSDMQPVATDPLNIVDIQSVVSAITGGADFATASFILNVGDRVAHGRALDWTNWLSGYWRPVLSGLPIVPTTGNHDYDQYNTSIGYTNSFFTNIFTLPGREWFYTLDVGRARFIVLDTGYLSSGDLVDSLSFRDGQWAFFNSSLAAAAADKENGNLDFIFLAFHNCIVSTGYHGSDSYIKRLRVELEGQIRYYNVDMVFNGHDHSYQRNVYYGVPFIVTGTGGGYHVGGNGVIHPENAPSGLVNQFYSSAPGYNTVAVDNKTLTLSFKEAAGGIADTVSYKQMTVRYHNPRGWTDVYINFANHNTNDNPLWHPYPGRRMKSQGDGWYSYTVLVQENSLHQFKLYCNFNNGSDLEDDNSGANYVVTQDVNSIEGTNPQGSGVPNVSILSPGSGSTFIGFLAHSSFISVSGTASVSSGTVNKVQLSVNGGDFFDVSGTGSWSVSGVLVSWDGISVLQARAVSDSGKTNLSPLCFVTHRYQQPVVQDGVRESAWDGSGIFNDSGDHALSVAAQGNSVYGLTSVHVTNDAKYLYLGFPVPETIPGNTVWFLAVDTTPSTGGTNLSDSFGITNAVNTVFDIGERPDYMVMLRYASATNSYLDALSVHDATGNVVHRYDSGQGVVSSSNSWAEVRIPLQVLGLVRDDVPGMWFAVSSGDGQDIPLMDSIPAMFQEPSGVFLATQQVTNLYFNYQIR